MENNIISKENYIKGMLSGFKQVADIIRETYGGGGINVTVQSKLYPYQLTTNDGKVIVQNIKLDGYAQNIAHNYLKELCDKQDKLMGNGRKTTILLLDKMLEEGFKYEGDKNQLKRDLDALIPFIESEIDKQTEQITVDEIEKVATTASENPETGALLQEIYQKIGRNGIIQVQGSGTYETSYKETNGIRFDMTGMYSPDMVHEEGIPKDKKSKAIYEKPIILVTRTKITNDDDLDPLLLEMANAGQKDLVIFTHGMDSGVASKLVALHKSGRYNILIIKNASIWRDFVYEDFAKCVGATVIDETTGKNFKNLTLSDLGTCDRIEVDETETIIIGNKDISTHIDTLKARGDDDSKLRLEWLSNKSAILKLGSNSETDLSLKLLKTKDAIKSSELALKYGVVKGGGLCLKEISKTLGTQTYLISESKLTTQQAKDMINDLDSGNPILVADISDIQPIIVSTAHQILKEALKAPYEVNLANGVKEIPDNIVDASQVVKASVRHAIGVASTILTAPIILFIPKKSPEEMAYDIAMQKNQSPF